MGTLKSRLLRLADVTMAPPPIESDDWHGFWQDPQSAEEFFSLQPQEIRYVRDSNLASFSRLLVATARQLVRLAGTTKQGIDELQLLNCLRLLTKFLPFLYELPQLSETELNLFWSNANANAGAGADQETTTDPAVQWSRSATLNSSNTPVNGGTSSSSAALESSEFGESHDDDRNSNGKIPLGGGLPLGAQMVEAAVTLLFTSGFTVESSKQPGTLDFSLWEPGVGSATSPPAGYSKPKIDLDSNRLEVLRYLLSLGSQCIYTSVSDVVLQGSRYLTWLVTRTPKVRLLALLSSLMNVTCRSLKENSSSLTDENGLEFEVVSFKELRILFVTHAIQTLSLLLVYPLPKSDIAFLNEFPNPLASSDPSDDYSKEFNMARYYCGRIYKQSELDLLCKGFVEPLMKTVEQEGAANSSFSNWMKSKLTVAEPSVWSVELLVLLWEFYQCNKKFRTIIAQTYGPRLMVSMLYNVWAFRNNEKYKSFVRLSAYMTLFLASDHSMRDQLLQPIDRSFYHSLPQGFKLSVSPTTYRDFLVSQISNIVCAECPQVLHPTLVELLYNFVPLAALYTNRNETPTSNRRISQRDLAQGTIPPEELSYAASSGLIQLINKLSSPGYLVQSETNPDLLALVIRAVCHTICRVPDSSSILLYTLSKSPAVLENVRKGIAEISRRQSDDTNADDKDDDADDIVSNVSSNDSLSRQTTRESVVTQRIPPPAPFSSAPSPSRNSDCCMDDELELIESLSLLDSDAASSIDPAQQQSEDEKDPLDEDIVKPKLPVGMSEHAKSKQQLYASLEETWPGSRGLKLVTDLIEWIDGRISLINHPNGTDATVIINKIAALDAEKYLEQAKLFDEYDRARTTFEPLKFTWSHMALGWYEAMLWGSIYMNYNVNKSKKLLNEISSSLTTIKRVSASWGFGWNNASSNNSAATSEASSRGSSVSSGASGNGTFDHRCPYSGTGLQEDALRNMVDNAMVKSGAWSGTEVKLFKVSHNSGGRPGPPGRNNSADSVSGDPFRKRHPSQQALRRRTLPNLSPQTSHRDSVSSLLSPV